MALINYPERNENYLVSPKSEHISLFGDHAARKQCSMSEKKVAAIGKIKCVPLKIHIFYILSFVIIVGALTTNCSQPSSTDTSTSRSSSARSYSRSTESKSIEYKMASINKGGYISESDPTIESFRLILNRLDRECPESRSLLADMIVKTWDMFKERSGRNVSLLWVAQQLNDSVPGGMDRSLKFAEIAAAWLTLASN